VPGRCGGDSAKLDSPSSGVLGHFGMDDCNGKGGHVQGTSTKSTLAARVWRPDALYRTTGCQENDIVFRPSKWLRQAPSSPPRGGLSSCEYRMVSNGVKPQPCVHGQLSEHRQCNCARKFLYPGAVLRGSCSTSVLPWRTKPGKAVLAAPQF